MKRVLIFSILYILVILGMITVVAFRFPLLAADVVYVNVAAESFIAVLLTGIVISTQFLMKRGIEYWLLLIGFIALNIAYVSDTLDELLQVSDFYTLLFEDLMLAGGFVLMFSGTILWVKTNNQTHVTLQNLANTDPLTGCLNRNRMNDVLMHLYRMSVRYDHGFSIVMMDLDHFKQINDTYGHAVGDKVLKRFVVEVKSRIRDSDSLIRYGGEEFLLVLPATDLEGAVTVGERIRVDTAELHDSDIPDFTTSIGVSTYTDGDTINILLKRADQALYEAKKRGRNCIVQM